MRQELAKRLDLVARVASTQYGVVTSEQLRELGFSPSSISRLVTASRLHRVHRGVYAVGHAGLSREGLWLAAVLACGAGAVLSHGSAASLWGLLSSPDVIHVTVPGTAGRASRKGMKVHYASGLARRDLTRRRNIPVTTPERTLRDLQRTAPRRQFEAALRQADVLGLRIGQELEPDRTRSELERRFLALCRRHRLPRPRVNQRVGPYLVDFLWPAESLVVELDGYRFHRGRSAFEADRARDLELRRRGYEVVRLTWRQLDADPARIAAAIRALLSARPPR